MITVDPEQWWDQMQHDPHTIVHCARFDLLRGSDLYGIHGTETNYALALFADGSISVWVDPDGIGEWVETTLVAHPEFCDLFSDQLMEHTL